MCAAIRKHPPKDAVKTIEFLAAEGYSIIGISRALGVSRETFKKWCEEDGAIQEAFEVGRETERQRLHALIVQSAVANKPANVNAFFILKARHGYREADATSAKVDVTVAPNVLVVVNHGTDEEWAAKVAAHQRGLMLDAASPHQIEAPQPAQADSQPSYGPPTYLPPAYASQAAPVLSVTPPAPVYDALPWHPRS
jgi:hypothetical protein